MKLSLAIFVAVCFAIACILFGYFYFSTEESRDVTNVDAAIIDPNDDYQLELVQVLFRHGDRIPDEREIYETDPYKEIFKSYGYGQLTKVGKLREYRIGELLRRRYGQFLGDYKNQDVHAYSTNTNRTKMSLKLVLAGLYQSKLPMATHINAQETSFLKVFSCPSYKELYKTVERSAEIQEKYRDFYEYLHNKTGIDTLTPSAVFYLHANLHAAKSLGLPLPDWCSEKDYEIIKEISHVALQQSTRTDQMKRTMGGSIIEKFLTNAANNGNGAKIYLYGGHDINIASFTNVHNFTGIPDLPDYGSTIIFEKLRGRDNQIYIRMYLWTGVGEQLIPLKLKNCEQICPLSAYTKIIEHILPNEIAKQCIFSKCLHFNKHC